MSIVISQGFYMKDMPLGKLKEIVASMKPKIEVLAKQRFDLFVNNIVKDDLTEDTHEIKVARAYNKWMERRERIDFESKRDPFVDISFVLTFIPVNYGNNHYLLGIVQTTQKEMYQEWLGVDGVDMLFYDDRDVKPDSMSDEKWEFFKSLTDQLTTGLLSEQGFTIDVVSRKTVFPLFY